MWILGELGWNAIDWIVSSLLPSLHDSFWRWGLWEIIMFGWRHGLGSCHVGIVWVLRHFSHVWFFETPWTAACWASLSITSSQSLLKLMSIELVMPSNQLILFIPYSSCLQSFPASRSFPVSQFLASGGQSIGVSASASVLPMNIQYWFPLGSTGLISLQSKGTLKSLLQHHSSKASILWCSAFFIV